MLQISTGKFFTREEVTETVHAGVLYSNASMHGILDTCIGSLEPAVRTSDLGTLVYRVTERLEAHSPDGKLSFLASTGGREMVIDFASVAAFGLKVLVTPDAETARRLIGGRTRAGAAGKPLLELVPRVFDPRVEITPDDRLRLATLADELVGLKRNSYLAAIRAIRRYTLGVERIADEPDLAYVLFVAALESLAQDFDGFQPTWKDLAQSKREAIDAALLGAPDDVAERVRSAVLGAEHAAVSRRFREFVLAHVDPAFFRDEAVGSTRPAQRAELGPALDAAYKVRSKYVHALRELPQELKEVTPQWDVVRHGVEPMLTFRGLSRLAHHVISRFISSQPKVATETFNYWSELPNIIRVQLANRYWIWSADGFTLKTSRRYLGAFLDDAAGAWQGQEGAVITAMPDVLKKIERMVPGLAKPAQRLSLVTLYFLVHQIVGHHMGEGEEQRVRFLEKHIALLDEPSVESMVAHVVVGQESGWSARQFGEQWRGYMEQRFRTGALVLPRVFEAGCLLTLAELHRRVGNSAEVGAAVSSAVEVMPGHTRLLELEASLTARDPTDPILWVEILSPGKETSG